MPGQSEDTAKVQSEPVAQPRFLFIIGAMKCGTTSLFELLSQHPEICGSKIKETDFFTESRSPNEASEYLTHWRDCLVETQYLLESSVSYTKYPYIKGVPERIKDFNKSDCLFIYMIRNPLTRIESQARHALFAGWGRSLDDGMDDDLIAYSKYHFQLDQYLSYFDKDKFKVIKLEDLQNDPNKCLKGICQFLKINDIFTFSDVTEVRNSGEFFNLSPSAAGITQSKIGAFISKRVLPKSAKNYLRGFIARHFGKTPSKKPLGRWVLTDDERVHVKKQLSDDLKKLESEFNIDISDYR